MKTRRTPGQVIADTIEFVKLNNRFPCQSAVGEERSLAFAISNYKYKGKFTKEQLDIIENLRQKHAISDPQMSPEEKLEALEAFCKKKGTLPNQDSKDEKERNLYAKCRKSFFKHDPVLLKRYEEIIEKYRRGKSSENVINELIDFVLQNHHTPRESSNVREEIDLAIQIKSKKNRNSFTREQLLRIDEIYKTYGPNHGTSIWEQILYHFLQFQLGLVEIINRDKSYGNEIDILVKFTDIQVAIFYDGAYFHSYPSTLKRDNEFNQFLTQNNVLVFRFREKGCPALTEHMNLSVIEVNTADEACFVTQCIEPFFLNTFKTFGYDSIKPYDINKLLVESRVSSSCRYTSKKHLVDFISECVFTEKRIDTNSKISRNSKGCFQRNKFTDKEQLLYAFTKRLYDSVPRKRRNIDAPSTTNDDIELLFQIIEVVYANTAYNHSDFKELLTTKINNL